MKNHLNAIEKNLFCVCGVTANDPGKERNDEFLEKIMNSVKDELDKEFLEGEHPFSCV